MKWIFIACCGALAWQFAANFDLERLVYSAPAAQSEPGPH
jgi:hypothetical protein